MAQALDRERLDGRQRILYAMVQFTHQQIAVTFLSLGTPMFVMGDEVRRTQRGNNNAYCHDNEISWFDWKSTGEHADLLRFVQLLCKHRLMRQLDSELEHLSLNELLRRAQGSWHGVKLGRPDWNSASHSLARYVVCHGGILALYLVFNAYWESLEFELPQFTNANGHWHRWIDTSLESPDDIVEWRTAPSLAVNAYRAGPRSVVALYAHGIPIGL